MMQQLERGCPGCEEVLSASVTAQVSGESVKSCPKCSTDVGIHVFYSFEDFGWRRCGEHQYIQSWCSSRRKSADGHPAPKHRCEQQ